MFYKMYYIYLEWFYKLKYKLEMCINPEESDYYSESDSNSDTKSEDYMYYNNDVYF